MNESSDTAEKGTVQLREGDVVGNCSNCGGVLDDDLEMNFPVGASCRKCGDELEKVKVVSDPLEVTL